MAGTVITTKGRRLIAKLLALEAGLEFTRVSVGTGKLPTGYDPHNMVGLNQYRMDGKITEAAADGEIASITFQVASADVAEGFMMTEVGLFASDPDEGEILYAYLELSDDPQYIYSRDGEISKVAEITLGVIVGEVNKVTASIAPDGLVTREVFEEAITRITQRLSRLGRVLVGESGTQLENNDTLFIIADDSVFQGAAYSNMVFSADAPAGAGNWGRIETSMSADGGQASPSIIQGNLTVAEEPASDTVFFAKINK